MKNLHEMGYFDDKLDEIETIKTYFKEADLLYYEDICKYNTDFIEVYVEVGEVRIYEHMVDNEIYICYVDSLGIEINAPFTSDFHYIWNREVSMMRDKVDNLKKLIDKI